MSSLTIIIPTLNEAGSITELLRELAGMYPSAEIVVADDGSTDGTREKVRHAGERISLLDRSASPIHGITASVLEAIEICRTELVAVMDGDLQHPPRELSRMLRELRLGASLVVGCRAPASNGYSRLRAALSRLAAQLAWQRLPRGKLRVRDPMSGYFAARTELLKNAMCSAKSSFEPEGYKILFDFLKILSLDPVFSDEIPRVKEIFYTFGARRHGESKLRAVHMWHFLRAVFLS